jgi:hypothetical protein
MNSDIVNKSTPTDKADLGLIHQAKKLLIATPGVHAENDGDMPAVTAADQVHHMTNHVGGQQFSF